MTKTIKSEKSDTRYFLTINEQGQATDCSCKDRFYRHQRPNGCKHMSNFNREVVRAATFASLKERFDVRGQVQREARYTAYITFELSLGL